MNAAKEKCSHPRVVPDYRHIDGGVKPGDRVVLHFVCEKCGEETEEMKNMSFLSAEEYNRKHAS